MKVLISFLYLIVSLSGHGNTVYAELPGSIHCAANQRLEQPSFVAFFNNAEVIDSLKDDLDDDEEDIDVLEENTTEVNEGSTSKGFPKKSNLQNSWVLNFPKQFIVYHIFSASILRSPLPLGGSSAPIYLSNRTLRI